MMVIDGQNFCPTFAFTDSMRGHAGHASPQPGNEQGTTYTLPSGTYTVSESNGPAGYVFGGFSGNCDSNGIVTLSASAAYQTCTLTNRDIGSRRTPGYWKSHPAVAESLLPLSLGGYAVQMSAQLQAVFSAMDCRSAGGAVGCLAGHLLATKLNIANGTSACIQPTVMTADALLTTVGYAGPNGSYSLTREQRALAVKLAGALDAYNNDKKGCVNP
jgi:hypothetical protein